MDELTVGMVVYGEFPNAWFTVQALRAMHGPRFKLLVLDAAPRGCPQTRAVTLAAGGAYHSRPDLCHTAAGRDHLVRLAETPWVLVLDPHVLIEPGGLNALMLTVADGRHDRDILTGPLLSDDGRGLSSHWRPNAPGRLWGEWAADPRVSGADPFGIPMQGLGLFAAHRDHWPGLHPLHRGFGAEEGYLHEVYRRAGGRCLCLPALKWRHQFRGPANGAPYPRPAHDHPRNLLLHHRELGLDTPETVAAIRQQFAAGLPEQVWAALVREVEAVQPSGQMFPRPPRQKLLGVWYSNNSAPEMLLRNSLATVKAAAAGSRHAVTVVTCPWRPIPGNPFPEVLADLGGKTGHAAIVRQIRQCLDAAGPGFDGVVFLEHDVLYPPDHFDAIGDAFGFDQAATVVSNLNYEGLNGTGWLKVVERHEPMHQLAMRYGAAVSNLDRAAADCDRQGWAYLEPDHAADRSHWLRLPFDPDRPPAIHVNHVAGGRFTSHGEVCYAKESGGRTDHPFWGEHRRWWPAGPAKEKATKGGCGCGAKGTTLAPPADIGELFDRLAAEPSDFQAHMGTLRALAAEAGHVTEVSGWNKPALVALAAGCPGAVASFCTPPHEKPLYPELRRLLGDRFSGRAVNPFDAPWEFTDLLFLDIWHDADRVARLLALHAPAVTGRIVLHGTATFGAKAEDGGPGMLEGVRRFLAAHPEWTAVRHDPESHGLMVLSKLPKDKDTPPGPAAKLLTFGKAVVRHAADRGKPAAPEVKAARLALCTLCEHRTDDRCGKCGCVVEWKAGWASESCPVGKWGRV